MATVGQDPCQWRACLEPDHIAGPDFLNRPAFALHYDQRLTQRVGVPRRGGAGFNRHKGRSGARRGLLFCGSKGAYRPDSFSTASG